MRRILFAFPFLFLPVLSSVQTTQYVERLDSIMSDNGDITRFKYDEQLRVVEKSVFQNDRLVRKEVTEYAEDGEFSDFCVYEERKRNDEIVLVPVHRKVRAVKDNGGCIELRDFVEVEGKEKLVRSNLDVFAYDENGELTERLTIEYDLKSDEAYNQHHVNYDAEGNKTREIVTVAQEYSFAKEYKDGKLYLVTKLLNKDGQWATKESTVKEYYESGALKCEYSYDYSDVIFYMKDYVLYDENGEKVKSLENQQTFTYKYTRDEKGRVKEVQKYLLDSDELVDREVYYYDVLPIDSAYYTLRYAKDETEPYAKYYYIPDCMAEGKVEGEYSVYVEDKESGSWINQTSVDNALSHSYADKTITAHYNVNDETITFSDYTLINFTDYGKVVKKQEKGLLVSEEEVYYDKSLSGSLVAGLEEDYKVNYVISRDAENNEVKNTYFYTHLGETTSIVDVSTVLSTQSSVYNIQGQRLESPQKGINIIGGRKVILSR
jgi:hypothetical protein